MLIYRIFASTIFFNSNFFFKVWQYFKAKYLYNVVLFVLLPKDTIVKWVENINTNVFNPLAMLTGHPFTILFLSFTGMSVCIPEEDAYYRACSMCVLKNRCVQNKIPGLTHTSCCVYHLARSVTSQSFSGWDKVSTRCTDRFKNPINLAASNNVFFAILIDYWVVLIKVKILIYRHWHFNHWTVN